MKKFPTLFAVAAICLGTLSGCATVSSGAAPEQAQVSSMCGGTTFYEWGISDDMPSSARGAIERIRERWSEELAKIKDLTTAPDASIPVDDDPIRIMAIIRGLDAAIEAVDAAESKAIDKRYFLVVGVFDGLEISQVYIDYVQPESGYTVSQFSALGLTSDHPSCKADG